MGCGSSAPSRSGGGGYGGPARAVWIRSQGTIKSDVYIHPDGVSPRSHPLYTATVKTGKPNIRFYQGPSQGRQQIGDANFSQWSSTSAITLRGRSFKLQCKGIAQDCVLKDSPLGELRWKNTLSRSMTLVDKHGKRVASCSTSGSDIKLEIWTHCDDFTADLIILSYLLSKYCSEQWEMNLV